MTDVMARGDLMVSADAGARVVTRQGGAGGNVAHWLAALGCPVALVGRVGADPFGEEARRVLADAGVQVHLSTDPQLPTGTRVVLTGDDGERTTLPDAGANSTLAPDDIPDALLGRAGHLHLSGYTLLNPGSREAGLSALHRAAGAGLSISVDAADAAPLDAVGGKEFLRMTDGVGLALCTLDEADVLCGSRDPAVAAARLTATYPSLVLKLGADGALWCSADDLVGVRMPASASPTPVVDGAGAGDGFTAALLATVYLRHPGLADADRDLVRVALERACLLAAEIDSRPDSRPPV